MTRRNNLLVMSVLRELICLGCVVLLIESKVAAQVEAVEATPSAESKRPDWVGKTPYEEGDTYVWPVASQAGVSFTEGGAEASLRQNAVAAVKEYIEIRLIRDEEAGRVLSQNSDLRKWTFRDILAPDRFTEHDGNRHSYRRYGVLRFTPQVNREIERRWQQHLKSSRHSPFGDSQSQVVYTYDAPVWRISPIWIFAAVAIVLLLALRNPHARRVIVGLVLGGIVLLFLVSVMWYRTAESPAEVATVRIPTPDNDTIPIGQAEAASVKPAADAKEPEWIHEKPDTRGRHDKFAISSGKFADPSMVKESLDAKLAAAAERRVSYVLGEPNLAEKLHINSAYVRDRCITERYDAEDNGQNETYLHLKFDEKFDHEVKKRYREYVSTSRVEKLGGTTLGVLGVIAAALAYLRFTKPREERVKRDG
jgi:hypothetical protein